MPAPPPLAPPGESPRWSDHIQRHRPPQRADEAARHRQWAPWVAQVNGGWLKDRGALSRILLHSNILSKRSKILTWASIQAGYRCTSIILAIYEGRSSLMCLFCGHYPIRPISHPPHASAKAFSYRSSKIWFCALMNGIPMRKVIFKWAKRTFSIPK